MAEPRVRFRQDEGGNYPAWQEYELNKILIERNEPHLITEDAPQLSFTIEQGVIYPNDKKTNKRDFLMKDKDNKKFLLTELNDIIYNPANLKFGAIHRNTLGRGVVSPIYAIFHTDQNSEFIEGIVTNPKFIKRSLKYLEGSVIKLMTLKPRDFVKMKVWIPCIEEQKKIANFLSSVDEVITASEKEVANLETQKKAVMKKIFSQEVRFRKLDGGEFPEWKEKVFSTAFESLNNNTFSRDMLNNETGNVKNIHYGDILVKYGSICDIQKDAIPLVNDGLDTNKYSRLRDGDIILADTAEDETVGKAIEIFNINEDHVISGLHTMACRPVDRYAAKFLGYYINSPAFHDQLRPFMQGIKVTSIGRANISCVKLFVPQSLEEQRLIADFLSNFDDAISAAKKELELWKVLKKGLLQQMFV